jgi:hypothetical protein
MCLSPFFVDGNLQCIVAFNRDAHPWGQHFDLPEPTTGCLTITFLDDEDLIILLSAVHEDQLLLRDGFCRQMAANGQPPPIFEGFVRDIPKISQTPRFVTKFDPAACPCGSDDKHSSRHQGTAVHKAWLLQQAGLAESDPLAVPADGSRWWSNTHSMAL